MFELVDVSHQESAARGHVGWRDHVEYLNSSCVGAGRGVEVSVASDHRSPEEVLAVDHQSHLRPPCRCLYLKCHLEGKIPHEILLILRGMLTDARILSMSQFPSLPSDSGIHHR